MERITALVQNAAAGINPSGYEGGVVPGAMVALELYPFAFGNASGALAGFGLCAAGLTRGDYLLAQSTVHTMPADLARMFDVPGQNDSFWQL